MSTPIRQDTKQDTKSEGPEAYAPRRMRMQSAPESQVSPSQIPSPAPEGGPPRAEQSRQPSAAATESTRAADARIDDAIQAIIDLGRSFRDAPLAAADSYPPAGNFEPERTDFADRRPYLSEPRWLDRDFDETGRWRRFHLDPQMVPPPPGGTRRHIVAPLLFAVMAACAAVIGLAMISAFQPGARWAKGASDRTPAVTQPANDVASDPRPPVRLVVENQRAFANEPLSLGVSVDSATGHESLLLGGLAAGTRLSAGARVSEASWQLSSHELNGVYVYAPKDFVGTMNTAIELLSPNRQLIESRAARLEWIAKPDPAPPTNRVGSGAAIAGRIQPLTPEAAAMMQRGRELLESGDVAASRLLFRHLADAGFADAALALAASYDPAYLAQHNLIGVVGDETKARDWYQRASELGSTEASRFLARTVTK
jgi:TPR repeat protein